jgi:hypothetical protein
MKKFRPKGSVGAEGQLQAGNKIPVTSFEMGSWNLVVVHGESASSLPSDISGNGTELYPPQKGEVDSGNT